jgi:ATPase subunit of ABC transporter with duplicated ATPase domains
MEGRGPEMLSRLTAEDLMRVLGGLSLGKEHCAFLAVGALKELLGKWDSYSRRDAEGRDSRKERKKREEMQLEQKERNAENIQQRISLAPSPQHLVPCIGALKQKARKKETQGRGKREEFRPDPDPDLKEV